MDESATYTECDDSPIIVATKYGMVDVVRMLVDYGGADVNSRSNSGFTSLHLAAQQGDADLAQDLIDLGADPNIQSAKGRTPLHHASRHGNEAVVRLSLALPRIDITIKDQDQNQPGDYASEAIAKLFAKASSQS